MRNLYEWTKLRAKTVTKAAECKLIKFFLLAIAQTNSLLSTKKAVIAKKALLKEKKTHTHMHTNKQDGRHNCVQASTSCK